MQANAKTEGTDGKRRRLGRWKLLAVLAVCAAPMIVSYFMYYVVKPTSRNNYGTLIDPRGYPIPDLGSTALDGKPARLEDYKGKWLMLTIGGGACPKDCVDRQIFARQLRVMQGKEANRVERVWLITDQEPLSTDLMRMIEGARFLRVDADKLRRWLPVEQGGDMAGHIYLIDPLGNLMMRFPQNPDPQKVKKDMSKLLKASAIG